MFKKFIYQVIIVSHDNVLIIFFQFNLYINYFYSIQSHFFK